MGIIHGRVTGIKTRGDRQVTAMPVPLTCLIEWTAGVYRGSLADTFRQAPAWLPISGLPPESLIRMSHWEPAWEHLGTSRRPSPTSR